MISFYVQVLIVILVQALILWKHSETSCNGVFQCTCQSGDNGLGFVMLCRKQNLNDIPKFIVPPELSTAVFYELNLEGNKIESIKDEAFIGTKFKRLVLSKNTIKSISDNAFHGLEMYLEELLLTFDGEMEMPVESLKLLTNLKFLEITGYGKSHLPESALATLVNLERLTLSHGHLQHLNQGDFEHQSALIQLNLEENDFTSVPDIFKTHVGRLSKLNLNINKIERILEGDFSGVQTLQILELSLNPIKSIDAEAFSSLESSLETLSCRYCQLKDEHLESVKSLISLKELNISGNEITAISSFWADLKSLKNLQRLDLQANRIESLSGSTFDGMCSSLRVLDLSDNPITSVDPETFRPFTQLQELQLNNIQGLNFDENTFAAQRRTLKTLRMSGARFLSPPLFSIHNLTELEVLVLSNCSIDSVPELTFEFTNKLTDLDLSNNQIESLTQRSLAGLQNSLVRIVLSQNLITTLDDCVFHQFSKSFNYDRLGLNNNPFHCDCSLKWLYGKLKLNKSIHVIKCADERNFFDLAAMFDGCPAVDSLCESLLPVTITPPPLQIIIHHLQRTSISISWTTHPADLEINEFAVSHQAVGSEDMSTIPVTLNDRQYVITDLEPRTTYMVCVLMKTAPSNDVIQSCSHAATTNGVLSTEAIIGISVGASIALLLILFFAAMFVRASRQRETHAIVLPQKGDHSKRFVKNYAEKETLAPVKNKANATIVQKLVEMSDEDRYRLVDMIAKRGGAGVDGQDAESDVRRGGPYVGRGMYSLQMSVPERHYYDEIPDEVLDAGTVIETSFIISETLDRKTKQNAPSPPPRPAVKTDKMNFEDASKMEGDMPKIKTGEGI